MYVIDDRMRTIPLQHEHHQRTPPAEPLCDLVKKGEHDIVCNISLHPVLGTHQPIYRMHGCTNRGTLGSKNERKAEFCECQSEYFLHPT